MAKEIPPERTNRMIVLIPDGLAGNLELAQKVYWMAVRNRCDVYYLALVDNEEKMLSIMRYMATMRAVTAGNNLVVQSELVDAAGWLKKLREIYLPGDRIVCHEEQSVKTGFLKTMPAAEFLQDRLSAPVTTISGFYHPQQIQINQWFQSLVAWLGFLIILFIFTFLEIRLDPVFHGMFGKAILGGLFIVEIGAIWAWDSIIRQSR